MDPSQFLDQTPVFARMVKTHTDQQADLADRMTGDINAVLRRENESRAAQMREMRRMQHERAMKAMEHDVLLRRLAAEQAEKSRAAAGYVTIPIS